MEGARKLLVEAVLALDDQLEIEAVDESQLTVKRPGGRVTNVALGNLAASIEGRPEGWEERLETFAASVLEALSDEAEVPCELADIVAVVRNRDAMLQGIAERVDTAADELAESLVGEPLAGPVWVLLAIDDHHSMQMASQDDVQGFGLELPELMKHAVANLRQKLDRIEQHGHPSGMRMYTAGGDYEASLILFDDLMDEDEGECEGELLAFIPARDLIVLVDSAAEEAVARALGLAEEILSDGAYPIWSGVLVRREGTWQQYDGPLPEPIYRESANRPSKESKPGWVQSVSRWFRGSS